jgi:Skp family chaperone for outer membrane proteins
MEPNGTTAGEQELILALAAGATVRQAAERASIGERTVYRRLADAEFRGAVSEVRDRMFDSARGQLAGLADKAIETLQRLMESDKPSEALAAAKAILQLGPRLRKATEFEEQMCRLEDKADERNGNQAPAADDELVLALAAGAPAREAADQGGIGEQAVQSRLADAEFRRAVSRARGRLFGAALGRLASLSGKATGVFARLLESDQPSVARRAAKAVLQLGPWLREATELQERQSRLQDEADERADREPAAVIDNGWYGE